MRPEAEVQPEREEESDDEIIWEPGVPDETPIGMPAERVRLQKDDEFVRKVIDPKLPTAREVQSHYEMGHSPYRNWCAICVRAKGKDMSHAREREG